MGGAGMGGTQAVRAWLEKKGIDRCTVCGSADLQVSKDLYALICLNRSTGAPDLGRGSRAVRIRCSNCAHLYLFHARQMGLE